MPAARSLEDLLRIRDANRGLIEAANANLGTALGLKTTANKLTKTPAVIIFVPSKVPYALIPPSQRIPKVLFGPDGLSCPTDVVIGMKAAEEPQSAPVESDNLPVLNELRDGTIGLIGGVQLGGFEVDGRGYVGTAACVVRRRADGKIGLLTNQHVGGGPGRRMFHPDPGRFRIGFTRSSFEYDADEDYLNGIINEEDAYFRIDCAFIELVDEGRAIAKSGLHRIGQIGDPLPLDLKTMGPIGKKVISIGRTRGVQRGTIIAFGYEWFDEQDSLYTDYLILGNDGGVFSDHGDSGKLIVTDDAKHNAVALLWGGWFEKLRRGVGQENWTYAIDINKVLGKLECDIVKGDVLPATGPGQAARTRGRRVAHAKPARTRPGKGAPAQAASGSPCDLGPEKIEVTFVNAPTPIVAFFRVCAAAADLNVTLFDKETGGETVVFEREGVNEDVVIPLSLEPGRYQVRWTYVVATPEFQAVAELRVGNQVTFRDNRGSKDPVNTVFADIRVS